MAGLLEDHTQNKSNRRRWILRDGVLLRGGNGDESNGELPLFNDYNGPGTQFNLAVQSFQKDDESEFKECQSENSREGVYWLIKASEQGHLEATNLLKKCLETGRGVTDHNIAEVIQCIETSTNEKLSVQAIRRLFSSCSEGEEFITNNQLIKILHCVSNVNMPQIEATEHESEDWIYKESQQLEKLGEDVLVSAARMYARGELPEIGRQSLDLMLKNNSTLKPVRFFCSVLWFPFIIDSVIHYLLILSPRNTKDLLFSPFIHFKFLIILYLCNIIQVDEVIPSLPNILYYMSFIIMVSSSCRMLKYQRRFTQFRRWSNLFLTYGDKKFSPEEAEFLYCRKGFSSYINFFLCLLLNLFIQSSFSHSTCFQAEITFVSFFFTIFTLVSFTLSKSRYMSYKRGIDYYGLLSFILHVLAKYPYETDSVVSEGWRFLDFKMPHFTTYVIGNGIEFCLNFRAFFYLIIPAVLFKMASRHNWRGIYSDLIPHCVTLSWWQLSLIYAEDMTWFSLIRPALAFAGVILFLPITILTSLILPFYTIMKFIMDYDDIWTPIFTFVAAISVPLVVLKTFSRRPSRRQRWNFYIVVQIILTLIASGLLFFHSTSSFVSNLRKSAVTTSTIDFNEFTSYCKSFEKSYTDNGKMSNQLLCSQTSGLAIHWKGSIRKNGISNIYNPLQSLIEKLPALLSKHVTCLLGERFPLCSDNYKISFCKSLLDLCHLSNWNRYEVKMVVEVSDVNGYTLPVTLIGNNNFFNVSQTLNVNDDVWFFGVIMRNENGIVDPHSPCIKLSKISCVSCLENEISETIDAIEISSTPFYRFAKYLFNFFLNPIIIFR